jgi:hypothetical protein
VGAFTLLLWGCRAPGARFGDLAAPFSVWAPTRIATYQRYSMFGDLDLTQIRRWTQTQTQAPSALLRRARRSGVFLALLGKCFPVMPLSTKEMASLQRLPLRCQSRKSKRIE